MQSWYLKLVISCIKSYYAVWSGALQYHRVRYFMHTHAYVCALCIYTGSTTVWAKIFIYICRWYTLSYPFYCSSIKYIAVDIEFPLLLQYMQYISFAVFYLVSPCLCPLPLRAEVNPRSICPLPFSHLGSVFRVLRVSSHEGEWMAAGEEKRHTVYPPGTSNKTMKIKPFLFYFQP